MILKNDNQYFILVAIISLLTPAIGDHTPLYFFATRPEHLSVQKDYYGRPFRDKSEDRNLYKKSVFH